MMREPDGLEEDEGTREPSEVTGPPGGPGIDGQLRPEQWENLRALISEFWDVFREVPEEARG